MKKILIYLGIVLFTFSCTEKKVQETSQKPAQEESLVSIEHGEYKEYYPGHKQLKFHGYMDNNQLRDGKWTFYNEKGDEATITMYKNGKKEGFSIVRYPNGALHYVGEYKDDKKIGKWEFYDEKGNKTVKEF